MKITKIHWIGIILSLAMIILSVILINTKFFFLLIGFGVLIGIFPFILAIINENRIASEKEEMFLEFARNLVESVKTGTPISKSIINLKNKFYGVLSENIEKLANQISLGIPLNIALKVFSKDVGNKSISRALTLIGQAERAGGNIGEILESVAGAVSMSDKLKKERKSTISTLVVQGYIIFFVFMIIILVMQFKILPMVSEIPGISSELNISKGGGAVSTEEISNAFLYLLLIQGFFSGLAIGKLAEGNIKAGIKHSFTLMLISFLVSAGTNLFFG
ncbi:MAG: type II secretion system F family protein [Nanoarchaeota archaeon]|nr:type II secretion system F family protein [Nanoarchaeota archaeon]MBU1028083.1 type II secretion system F family protein [Nanoarchaeota archaeon]